MRRTTSLGVLLLAGLAAVAIGAVPATAATPPAPPARPGVPTCLISNGGGGGQFTKSLTCVELLDQRFGEVGSGRYDPGPGAGEHWLTVSVQYRRSGHGEERWVPMATATRRGPGNLSAVTRPAWVPRWAETRACVTVGSGPRWQGSQICTRS